MRCEMAEVRDFLGGEPVGFFVDKAAPVQPYVGCTGAKFLRERNGSELSQPLSFLVFLPALDVEVFEFLRAESIDEG